MVSMSLGYIFGKTFLEVSSGPSQRHEITKFILMRLTFTTESKSAYGLSNPHGFGNLPSDGEILIFASRLRHLAQETDDEFGLRKFAAHNLVHHVNDCIGFRKRSIAQQRIPVHEDALPWNQDVVE